MAKADGAIPVVYSCSGCSSAAQLANHLAVSLHRARQAEMSCIAGVGGDVKPLVQLAKSGRPIVAIDGCPLHCVERVLARHGILPDLHLDLRDQGVKKRVHDDFDADEARRLLATLREDVAALARAAGERAPALDHEDPGCPTKTG